MPAPTDPRNTFEVTVPPIFSQDHLFAFTFHPASPGPIVSSPSVFYNMTTNLCISDGQDFHGLVSNLPRPISSYSGSKAVDPSTFLGRCLANSRSTHATADPRVEGLLARSDIRPPPPRPRFVIQ